jgi:DNA-binding transcriptional LysR family regulator
MGFMPESVKTFSVKFPEVDVSLIEMPLGEQIAGLEADTIQVGFAVVGSLPIPAGLKQIEIMRSPTRVVVGHAHRLAKARRVALADLVREPLLCLSNRKGTLLHYEIIRPMFTTRSLKPGPVKKIDGAEAFRAALESGVGVSLIPQMGSLSRSPDLVFKQLKDTGDDLMLELRALWSGRSSSVVVDNFINVLRQLKSVSKNRVARSSTQMGAK